MPVSSNGYVVRLQNLLTLTFLTIDETGLVAVAFTEPRTIYYFHGPRLPFGKNGLMAMGK